MLLAKMQDCTVAIAELHASHFLAVTDAVIIQWCSHGAAHLPVWRGPDLSCTGELNSSTIVQLKVSSYLYILRM